MSQLGEMATEWAMESIRAVAAQERRAGRRGQWLSQGLGTTSTSARPLAAHEDVLKGGAMRLARRWTSSVVRPENFSAIDGSGFVQPDAEAGLVSRDGTIVDLCICVVSLLGALAIILPYVFSKRSRKLRHSLILGLATSDLISSLVLIASAAFRLAGGDLATADRYCDFTGYALTSSIFTQHLWNLAIAIITYMILVLPLHAFTLAVERHMVWLWPIVWAIGLVVNGFAFGFVGYSNAGGFCNIASGRGGRYFNAIFTFVPRGFVVVVILILYTHLFFFLRRTNLFSSMSHRLSSHDHGQQRSLRSLTARLSRRSGHHPGDAEENAFGTPSQLVGRDHKGSHPPNGILQNGLEQGPRRGSAATTTSSSALGGGSTVSGQHRTPDSYKASGEEDVPAVTLLGKNDIEMVECANFCRAHEDGRGGTEVTTTVERDGHAGESPLTIASPLTKTAETRTPGESGAFSNTSTQPGDVSWASTLSAPAIARPTLPHRPSTAGSTGSKRRPPALALHKRPSTADVTHSSRRLGTSAPGDLESDEDADFADDTWQDTWSPVGKMRPRRDVVDFNMTSAPREHLRHFTFSPVATSRPPTSSGPTPLPSLPHSPSLSAAASGAKTGAAEDNIATGLVEEATDGEKTAAPHYEQALGDDWTWGMAVGGKTPATATGQQSRHTKETSARSSPARWWRRSIARQDVEGGRTTFGSNSSSTVDEHHVESLGSTLNRQASVLMLLYPAAYCLLFSVSIIRIITDLADPAPGHRPKDPNGALRAISRWFVFAQGAFDAIIFQIVERQFRSRMKRRRQKAAGEAVDPSILSRVRNFLVPSTAR